MAEAEVLEPLPDDPEFVKVDDALRDENDGAAAEEDGYRPDPELGEPSGGPVQQCDPYAELRARYAEAADGCSRCQDPHACECRVCRPAAETVGQNGRFGKLCYACVNKLYATPQPPLPGVPTRMDFVRRNAADHRRVQESLAAGSAVYMCPVYVEEGFKESPYVLRLYGPLSDGTKACVAIEGVRPSFDVRTPDGEDEAAFTAALRERLADAELRPWRALPAIGYNGEPASYVRCSFVSKGGRDRGLERLNSAQAETNEQPARGPAWAAVASGRADAATAAMRAEGVQFVRQVGRYETHGMDEFSFRTARDRARGLAAMRGVGIAPATNARGAPLGNYHKLDGLELANNDASAYYRKVARDHKLTLANWLVIARYKTNVPGAACDDASDTSDGDSDGGWRRRNEERESVHLVDTDICPVVLRAQARYVRALIDEWAPKDQRQKGMDKYDATPSLQAEPTLSVCWDIETITDAVGEDGAPRGNDPQSAVFKVCLSAHWRDDDGPPLAAVVISTVPTAPDARWHSIVVPSQAAALAAIARVVRQWAPDMIVGFNDSDYDWPFIVKKAYLVDKELLPRMYDLMSAIRPGTKYGPDVHTCATIGKWKWKRAVIKIAGGDAPAVAYYPDIPGVVMIDVRTQYRKIFPRQPGGPASKSSLKTFLSEVGLPHKVDMPIQRMWRYYREARAAVDEGRALTDGQLRQQREIDYYNYVDTVSCQRLMCARTVPRDLLAFANISYSTVADAYLYAGGAKVTSTLAGVAARSDPPLAPPLNCWTLPRKTSVLPKAEEPVSVHGSLSDPLLLEIERARNALTELAREPGKYPGAIVFRPQKGLHNNRPVFGLDYSSLYPSVIIGLNLSPETIVHTEAEAARLRAQKLKLWDIEFMYNGVMRRAWSVQHEGKLERYGWYPRMLTELMLRRKEIKAEMKPRKHTLEVLSLIQARREPRGKSCEEVFQAVREHTEAGKVGKDARGAKELNAVIAELDECVKWLTGGSQRYALALPAGDAPDMWARFDAAVKHVQLQTAALDSRQKAVKVLMNTVYGKTGDPSSPLFILEIAGGITSWGRFFNTMSARIVVKNGHSVVYGDTDSVYVKCGEHVYAECDRRWAGGEFKTREEYWHEMVLITIRAADGLRDEINAELKRYTGAGHLSVAYEEVLFPVTLLAAKKYWGIPHEGTPNFHPKELFVRGVDVLRRGQSELARTIGLRSMWESMQVKTADDGTTLIQIVEKHLLDAVQRPAQWHFEHFVLTDTFRESKNNVAVRRFVERMRAAHEAERRAAAAAAAGGREVQPALYTPPQNGERFEYVITHPDELDGLDSSFDLAGYTARPGKGDVMTFKRVVLERARQSQRDPMEFVDVSYYIRHYVIGQCARMIAYAFEPADAVMIAGELPKINEQGDDASYRAAIKHLEALLDRVEGIDGAVRRKRGTAYRRVYNNVIGADYAYFMSAAPAAARMLLDGPGYQTFSGEADDVQLMAMLDKRADMDIPAIDAAATVKAMARKYKTLVNVAEAASTAPPRGQYAKGIVGAAHRNERTLEQLSRDARARVVACIPALREIAVAYEHALTQRIVAARRAAHRANPQLGQAAASANDVDNTVENAVESHNEEPRAALVHLAFLDERRTVLLQTASDAWRDWRATRVALAHTRAVRDALRAHREARLAVEPPEQTLLGIQM